MKNSLIKYLKNLKRSYEISKEFKVGNVRIYSRNKSTGEHDALGLKNYLPLKIVGNKFIGKDLKKADMNINVDFLGTILDEVPPEISTDIEEIQLRIKEYSRKKKELENKIIDIETIIKEIPKKIEELEIKRKEKEQKGLDYSDEENKIKKLSKKTENMKLNYLI